MSSIDWCIIAAYLLYIVYSGIAAGKEKSSLEDFFLAKRSLPWWAVGLSVMATQMSAITLVGTTGKGYQDGLRFIQFYFGLPLAMIIIAFTAVPFFRKAKVFTAYEFLERRFDSKTRTLTSIFFLVSRGLSCGVIIAAPSIVLSLVLGWSEALTIATIGLSTTLYTMYGGVRAVTWTDVRQMIVIILGLSICYVIIWQKLPAEMNFNELLSIAKANNKTTIIDTRFDLNETYTLWSGLIGGLFLMLAYFGCDQSQVQRYLTARSDKDARNSLYLNALLKIPLQLLVLSLGVLIFIFHQSSGIAIEAKAENVNQIFPSFVLEHLPIGAVGLMIAAIFAAAMSSISSELNALATTSVMDIYRRLIKPNEEDQHYLLISKAMTLFWGAFACVVAYFASALGSLIEVVNLFGSYFYGSLLGVFALAFFSKRCSSNGAFFGLFFGIAAVATVAINSQISFLWYNLVGVLAVVPFGYSFSLIENRD